MTNGPISPDGRSQWNGTEWVAIPAPPKQKLTAHNYFQIVLIFGAVIVGLLIVGSLVGG